MNIVYFSSVSSLHQYSVKTEITVKEDAQQFLATVSSENHYNNYVHTHGTTEDILQYALKEESMATSRIGCYAGTRCLYIMHILMTDCVLSKVY